MTDAFTVAELAACWPVPGIHDHKYTRGVVGIDAGSPRYPGAGLLAVAGAMGAGPGMVRYLGGTPGQLVIARHPSVVLVDGQVQALVLGPGWGTRADAGERLERGLERGVPTVIDADALRRLPQPLPPRCLLTPHAGELALLLGVARREVEADPVAAAQQAATSLRATVLLKGGVQPVASPDGEVRCALPGPAWSAQAGSGDVLAGVCGTLLAAGLGPHLAALAAASLQALAATRFPGPWPPQRQAERFPGVVAELVSGARPPATCV